MNEVTVYFDSSKEHVRTDRLPQPNNLQPYNVTQTEAILYAIHAGIPDDAHTYEVRILFWEKVRSDDTPINKYVWVVGAWLMEPYSNGSVVKNAYVDPHSGEVYGLDEVSVHSTA
jgi:hypothetical protein